LGFHHDVPSAESCLLEGGQETVAGAKVEVKTPQRRLGNSVWAVCAARALGRFPASRLAIPTT